ncbi:Oidioi.mRNA.OKI2018_I69.PAR.g9272.t1.cds [Oikopleura dioica]|uniref:Oidioi.mRNA.OKI2018_I69.PAR.g9272.t1.cds n=1 Tax=Oikopleura dioica TaxID=34765 RepID=A0ABN7RKV1_OIKDI|nr:Oidioi.mRNA.OKI2018_I69.PAR.g9272.t1.cds [Oikopleura dioica]
MFQRWDSSDSDSSFSPTESELSVGRACRSLIQFLLCPPYGGEMTEGPFGWSPTHETIRSECVDLFALCKNSKDYDDYGNRINVYSALRMDGSYTNNIIGMKHIYAESDGSELVNPTLGVTKGSLSTTIAISEMSKSSFDGYLIIVMIVLLSIGVIYLSLLKKSKEIREEKEDSEKSPSILV